MEKTGFCGICNKNFNYTDSDVFIERERVEAFVDDSSSSLNIKRLVRCQFCDQEILLDERHVM